MDNIRPAQRFWERYFGVYDTLNLAIPYRRMIERHAELLAPSPGEHILDAGAGTGNVAVELLARGARVTGIDFCQPALDRCRQKAPQAEFRFGDLTRPLEFRQDFFDKIACCCVLHVLNRADQEFAVRELSRIVKPGGTLVVTVFASGFNPLRVYFETLRLRRQSGSLLDTLAFGLRYSLDTARILYYVWRIQRKEKSGEYHFFSREDLTGMVERAGMRVELVERVFAGQCWTLVARK